ncbi:hypothetical protein TNCV_1100831 [Trichonephila clavipes]|nr:hypothetical protein TNCV_1100831 [Trichonephila clavipes]
MDQHVIELQIAQDVAKSWHKPDFYTCQTNLSDTDPVGIVCCIINSKVEYVSVDFVLPQRMVFGYQQHVLLFFPQETICHAPVMVSFVDGQNRTGKFWTGMVSIQPFGEFYPFDISD